MKQYICEICGKKHEVFQGIDIPTPEKILEIPEEDLEKRVTEANGNYIIDGNLFLVKGTIFIYSNEDEDPFFEWSIWASLSLSYFKENFEEFNKGNNIELSGKLETQLPFYEISKGLNARIILNINHENAVIRIEDECRLKIDQSSKISKERIIEIMQMVYHNPERENMSFDKPFNKRLRENIIEVEKEYLSKGLGFIIDLSSTEVLIQIVNNNMLEEKASNINGFGIQIAFDHSFESTKEEFAKFKGMKYSAEFNCYQIDGVTAYQIDVGMNVDKIEELVPKLITDIFEENLEKIQVENFKE